MIGHQHSSTTTHTYTSNAIHANRPTSPTTTNPTTDPTTTPLSDELLRAAITQRCNDLEMNYKWIAVIQQCDNDNG